MLVAAALLVPTSVTLVACGASGYDDYGDYGDYGDFDDYGDADADSDADSDADADADADDDGIPPPEIEDEGDFGVARASGPYVYSASETTDRVAIIGSDTLTIDVVDVCRAPSWVEPVPAEGASEGRVAVLCRGSWELALISSGPGSAPSVEVRDIRPGANRLIVTPDGAHVIAYHDVDADADADPGAGSQQEITVIAWDDPTHDSELTVGLEPRAIAISADSARAWVTTADGINVIELDALPASGIAPLVPVLDATGIEPDSVEVYVATAHAQALARVDGLASVWVTDLDTGARVEVALPRVPTDLDLPADQAFALLTMPGIGGSSIAELALPNSGAPLLTTYDIPGEYVGLASLSADGQRALFYTSVDLPGVEPDPRRRITIGRRTGGSWADLTTHYSPEPVSSIGTSPGGEYAVVTHNGGTGFSGAGYTLYDVSQAFPIKKLQSTQVPPNSVTFTPNDELAVIRLRHDGLGLRRVEMADLASFIVDGLTLGSPPTSVGWVSTTQKIFITQEHPSGRLTFIDLDGTVQTVTGFELNDSVKD